MNLFRLLDIILICKRLNKIVLFVLANKEKKKENKT